MSTRSVFFRLTSLLLSVLFLFSAYLYCRAEEKSASASLRPVVILDAGHGGRDSGTVGVNGVPEKELNLAVALALGDLLSAAGYEVILTRRDDRLLYTEEQDIPGKRKQYDLYNRLLCAKMHPGAIFVSIHMNSFTDAKYAGLQVWCADGEESARLAECIRATVAETLQPENGRTVKKAGKNIYLLDRAVGVAVLVECGFLSNPAECEALSREDYRSRLCFSLFCAIIRYLNSGESK